MKKLLPTLRREPLQVVLLAVPFVAAAVWWDRLPARVVSHWDLHNQPDGWMPRAPGVLLLPVANVFLCILIALLPRIDPRLRRRGGAADLGQRRAWRAFRIGFSAFLAAISLLIIATAAGRRLDIARLCLSGAFGLLAFVGNYLANLEPNYLMGIRTP